MVNILILTSVTPPQSLWSGSIVYPSHGDYSMVTQSSNSILGSHHSEPQGVTEKLNQMLSRKRIRRSTIQHRMGSDDDRRCISNKKRSSRISSCWIPVKDVVLITPPDVLLAL